MSKIKSRKKLLIPIIAIMVLVVMAGNAMAGSSKATLDNESGTVYGPYKYMDDIICHYCIMTGGTSTYITGYRNVAGVNYDSVRIYQGDDFYRWIDYTGTTFYARSCLESIWGPNTAEQTVSG